MATDMALHELGDQPYGTRALTADVLFAALPGLLQSTYHCTDSSTVWLLPKGRNAESEVEAARHAWQ